MSLKDIRFDSADDVMLLARIAEQSEQYDDMIDILKPHFEARKDGDLTSEERNVLCVAYKNAVGMRRIAWRAACQARKVPKYQKLYENEMRNYVKKLEEELVNMCKDVLNLITKHLIPKAKKA